MASKAVQRTVPVLAGSLWWRVAGVSGFSAITLGAYGQHKLAERDEGDLKTWRTANRYRDTVAHGQTQRAVTERSVSPQALPALLP